MTTAQPGQEQRIADEEQFARQLLALRERERGFTDYADWLDAGCPRGTENEYPHEVIADICFYVATIAARPTAGLGEDGELVERVAFAVEHSETHPPGGAREIVSRQLVRKIIAAYRAQTDDRLILYREALEPFARYFDLNDCRERDGNIEVPISDLRKASAVLSRSGG